MAQVSSVQGFLGGALAQVAENPTQEREDGWERDPHASYKLQTPMASSIAPLDFTDKTQIQDMIHNFKTLTMDINFGALSDHIGVS
jgi:hypothetical protein